MTFTIGAPPPTKRPRGARRHLLAAVFFFSAAFSYILGGILCVGFPPTPSNSFGAHRISKRATCVRVNRHASHTTADVFVGTPPVAMTLLVRLDQLVEQTANSTNMRISSIKVVESKTVECVGTLCTDTALLQRHGPTSNQDRTIVRFAYTNAESETTPSVATQLGLDGQLSLEYAHSYYLTATHLCWEELATAHALRAHVADGVLTTNASSLVLGPRAFANTPVATAHLESECANTTFEAVGLFPVQAADEQTWLGLKSDHVYDTPNGISDRRAVVEIGTECAAANGRLARSYSLYQLDCLSVYTPCTTTATVPFRRVADEEMRIDVASSDEAWVWTNHDTRLDALPNLEDAGEAFALSIVKLLLMVLAAAIVWIRAAKETASVSNLFVYCLRAAHCSPTEQSPVHEHSVAEDAIVGLLAIVARGGIAIWRIETLAHDGQSRVAVFQLVAAILSLLHWVARYFVLARECESPLTKLGGSTALCDAPAAVMLAFSEPPLLVTAIGRFDPTARLLTALLLTMVSFQRTLFSAACCGLLYSVSSHEHPASTSRFDRLYPPILFASAIAWIFQAVAVAVLLADVFATPLAYSAARGLGGDTWALPFAVFFAVTAASLPQLMRSTDKLLSAPVK
jgi:hypothetical protein